MATWLKAGEGIAITGKTLRRDVYDYEWKTAYGSKQIESGKHKWKIKIIKGSWIMIGITSNTKYAQSNPTKKDDTNCYMYCGGDGHIYSKQGSKQYSKSFEANDIIEVMVDFSKRKLWFTRNGDSAGIPVRIDNKSSYRLTVSLFTRNTSVKLISYDDKLLKKKKKPKKGMP